MSDLDGTCKSPVFNTSALPSPAQQERLERDWYSIGDAVFAILAVWLIKYVSAVLYDRRREEKQKERSFATVNTCCFQVKNTLTQSLAAVQQQIKGIRPIPKEHQISLAFEGLGLHLKSNGKCILEGVTGRMYPGRLGSIMGPSGAGKTTVLNTLCGKATYGKISGCVYLNGESVRDISELKPVLGFVPQDDIVHDMLTAYEQIYYNVKLRNCFGIEGYEIHEIVTDILAVMQLEEVQGTVVGNVESRGISGGQRKRVNIALELAARPRILFLDEPTSGLDATTALTIIKSLQKLTQLGLTVIMVVHQPRYSLFELFDDVLLLGMGGHTVYSGPANSTKQYFDSLGFSMPPFENPADWFMDIIMGEHDSDNRSIPNFKSEMLFKLWRDKDGPVVDAEFVRLCSPLQYEDLDSPDQDVWSLKMKKPSFCRQYRILVSRSLITWQRQCSPQLMSHLLIILSACLQGFVTRGKVDVAQPTMCLNISIAHTTQALLVAVNRLKLFGSDRPLFWRESGSGISVISRYVSKLTWDTVSIVVECLIYISCWYVSSDVKGNLSIYLPSFMLVSLVASGWGYFLSAVVPPHNSTLAVVATIMIVGAAFGMPSVVEEKHGKSLPQDIVFMSSMFVWSTAMSYLKAVHTAGGCGQGGPCCDVVSYGGKGYVSAYFDLTSFEGDYHWQQKTCTLVLLLMSFVLYASGYISLKFTNRDKQV